MRKGMKIVLIIVALIVVVIFQVALEGGDTSKPGLGGPIGVILMFVFWAGAKAIWKYNPEQNNQKNEKDENPNDNHTLDKR